MPATHISHRTHRRSPHAHANTAHPLTSLDSVTQFFVVLRPAQYRDIFTPCHQLRASSTCFVDVNHTSTNTSPDQPISNANFRNRLPTTLFRFFLGALTYIERERWGAGVETQKNVRGEIRGWSRVPFNEPYAPSLSTIYDGA